MDSRTRYDSDTGVIRSFFGFPEPAPLSRDLLTVAEISNDYLDTHPALFNLDGISLALSEEKDGGSQITCKYLQYHENIPVYGAYLNVTLRKSDRQVVSSVNRIDYQVPVMGLDTSSNLTKEEALQILHLLYDPVSTDIIFSEPELYIFNLLLVWRIGLDSRLSGVHLEVLVNASDGSIAGEFDRRRFYSSRPAKVFNPDPVTSSQNSLLHWKSPLDVLNAERADVMLENLDEPIAGIYSLSGKWVTITDKERPAARVPTAGNDFIYSSDHPNFLSVMAYYYMDRLIDWLHSLEVPAFSDAMTGPMEVDAQGAAGADNSHFAAPLSGPVYIAFGEGGTPDASDPGVITHEFGHAVHYYLLGGLAEAGSFEEGFNDFLSCVFRDRFNIHSFDRANPFPWDNNPAASWDSTRRCDRKYRFDDKGYDKYGFYKKGTVYATALWEIYLTMGGQSPHPETRLKAASEITANCLEMLVAVGDTNPIMDLANGLISSDYSRTGGKYSKVIREAFRRRGLWD